MKYSGKNVKFWIFSAVVSKCIVSRDSCLANAYEKRPYRDSSSSASSCKRSAARFVGGLPPFAHRTFLAPH